MVRLLAVRSDTKSSVKLGGFQFQLQGPYVSSHIEELWYNETVCLWMIYIYIYIYIYMKTVNKSDTGMKVSIWWEQFYKFIYIIIEY